MKATKGGNFKPVPLPEPQMTIARCYSVIDIGTVPNIYNGVQDPDRPFSRKIYITWELPALLAIFNEEKGEEPFVIGLELTASTSEKASLSKLISQWRNKPFTTEEQAGFDPSVMIGKTAYITFQHKRKKDFIGKEIGKITNENTNLKFVGIMPKPKDVQAPPNRNKYISWDWDAVALNGFEKYREIFEKIPKWLQKKMSQSKEFREYAANIATDADDATDNDQGSNGEASKVSDGEW